jgi:DNA-directed RNA polymerase specialized sigma24 family protein
MIKNELKNYTHLRIELKIIDDEIKTRKNKQVSDVVRGSSPESPYTAHTIRVNGITTDQADAVLVLQQKREAVAERVTAIENYVYNIPDLRTQRMFQLRYLRGLPWAAVARRMGTTPDSVRMTCKRYIKKCEK